jgi:hypothetical protein
LKGVKGARKGGGKKAKHVRKKGGKHKGGSDDNGVDIFHPKDGDIMTHKDDAGNQFHYKFNEATNQWDNAGITPATLREATVRAPKSPPSYLEEVFWFGGKKDPFDGGTGINIWHKNKIYGFKPTAWQKSMYAFLDKTPLVLAGAAATPFVAMGAMASGGGLIVRFGLKGLIARLGVNYATESISSGSINPLDHNALSYPLSLAMPGIKLGKVTSVNIIAKQMLIGASSGLVEYSYGKGFNGFWNQNAAITTLKMYNGATAPFLGPWYGGFARQGLGGYGINKLEQKLKEDENRQ